MRLSDAISATSRETRLAPRRAAAAAAAAADTAAAKVIHNVAGDFFVSDGKGKRNDVISLKNSLELRGIAKCFLHLWLVFFWLLVL